MRQGAYSDAAKYFSQCLALFNQSMPQEDAVYLTAMIERAEMEVQHGVQPTEAIPAVGRLQADPWRVLKSLLALAKHKTVQGTSRALSGILSRCLRS